MNLKTILMIALFCCNFSLFASAQNKNNDTEFRKSDGAVVLLSLNNGFTSNFKSTMPDLYSGGLSLSSQWVVAENKLRAGVSGALVYHSKKLYGVFGPVLALKLKNIDAGKMGGLANTQLHLLANWGTNKQQTVGLAYVLELFQKVCLGLSVQRDYHWNYWWVQSHIGFKINKKKKTVRDFE